MTEAIVNNRIEAAESYVNNLDWWLVPVIGKNPCFKGWPDFKPDANSIKSMIESNWKLGIGLNLGGSQLIDLEADTPEGEMILDDLCEGIDFPYYQSRRGKHRIFQAHNDVGYLKTDQLIIEFRTGRHQSVLPPSPHPEAKLSYEWIINPFDVPPPPLPQQAVEYYLENINKKGNTTEPKQRSTAKQSFLYRDNLDYVLRYHDLLNIARDAGIEFAAPKPDINGNIPCFVPSALRGGRDDDHPSGVFNINNGVLRDFSTSVNHLFFKVMEALTGKTWLEIFKRFEKDAGAIHGRPHSRRIGVPTATITKAPTSSLEDARSSLSSYFEQELSRQPQPKTLHIVKGAPGLGKTYGICKSIAEYKLRAIILTLENQLATTHLKTLTNFGGNAARMPVLRESPCPHPNEYEATSRRGFQPSHGLPCQQCKIGPKHCGYLLAFSNLENADQICCAAIYHTHDDFYESYGNETRPTVIFDENCLDLLLAPQSSNIGNWIAWSNLLAERRKTANKQLKEHIELLLEMVSWLNSRADDFAATQDESGRLLKFTPFKVPDELKHFNIKKSPALVTWLNKQAFKQANRHISNLYDSALSLLTQQGEGFVLFERIPSADGDVINVRFRAKHPLPEDKEVFILDATVNGV
ncbi:MAG: bifunctional DNA primase/polymerase [Planctomycetaceae bacterium]|nr:bifunctional DNA primase/polymerase [Planctomycetales bacterium]MCB9921806.1 bifunctional DNA primase/polymerase [Planctomycetaceae bacterium]